MLINKYNYKNIKRKNIDGKRKYLCPVVDSMNEEYQALPSVTTILGLTKPQKDKDALAQWRKNVGATRAQFITTESANRGTRMHNYLEKYVIDGELKSPGSNPYAQQSNKMAQVIIDNGFKNIDELWGSEVDLYFQDIYAGATDLVGVHNGEPAILDFKQTNKPKTLDRVQDYFLQMTAYSQAHDRMFDTSIRKGVIMMCSKDYEYQEFIIEGEEFDKYRRAWWHRVEKYFEI